MKSATVLSLFLSFGIIINFAFFTPQNNKPINTGPANTDNKNVLPIDPEAAYKTYCAGCHGEKMDAFVDRKWKHGSSEADLFKAIKVGYHDEGMPGFDSAFTDKDISELVDYIVTGIKNVKKYDFKEKITSAIFKTESLTIRLDTVVSGLNSPWGLAFLPNNELLVTDKNGKLYRVGKKRQKQEVTGVPEVLYQSQGGLMDVELHPDFKNNGFIYLSYSKPKQSDSGLLATTAISRAKLSGNALTHVTMIFEALPYSKTRIHYGCRMEFGRDGYLYVTVGDRGAENQNPQYLNRPFGKIHRIKDDGSIPADNPFVNTPGALASVYSFGHRNPQGMIMHPATGALWSNEHGPRGGDEINIVQKGKNYGWPKITYGINYDGTVITDKSVMTGMEQPLLYWLPSIGPSGMAFVQGNRYKGWSGNLLVGSMRFKYLNLCKIKNNKVVKQEILFKNIGRVRDVRMGPDGYIYMSVESPGVVYRLVPVKK